MTIETKPILIAYATREGHTRRIAEHLAATARFRDLTAEVIDVRMLPDDFHLAAYSAVIVAASVHVGKHEKEMVRFVKQHIDALRELPSVFLSVSLTEASVEDDNAPPEVRLKAEQDVERMIEDFLKETGWYPSEVEAVAGALMYSKYNFLIRFVMKRIAAKAGGSTDTSQDHVYTDWEALDKIIDHITLAN